MNEHLATYPSSGGLTGLWLTGLPSQLDMDALDVGGVSLPARQKLDIEFRRIVLGMSFDPLFLCAVGERWFESRGKTESVYVVLDESLESDVPSRVLADAVRLKDQYRCTHLFAPESPSGMAEGLRKLEGLSYYPDASIEQHARSRWTGFVDFDTRAVIVLGEMPKLKVVTAELNEVMTADAIDPRTEMPMMGSDGEPIPKLLFLDDFPMFKTLQAVRVGSEGGCTALWYAIKGLERTGVIHRPNVEDFDRVPQGSTLNPTGY